MELPLNQPVVFGMLVNILPLRQNLQVGHPPGAPLLQMIGAFFSMFAFDDTHIAIMVNYRFWGIKCLHHSYLCFGRLPISPKN